MIDPQETVGAKRAKMVIHFSSNNFDRQLIIEIIKTSRNAKLFAVSGLSSVRICCFSSAIAN